MAIYEFKCEGCSLVQEIIMPMATATFEDRKCTKCKKKTAKHVLSAPNLATSGMSQAPIDVVIGRDAEARWADIRKRQAIREKVREASGEQAVSMTGRNEFQPIKGAERRFVKAGNATTTRDNHYELLEKAKKR